MKRRIAIGLVTIGLGAGAAIGLASPAQALPPSDRCHAMLWRFNDTHGVWQGSPIDGSGEPPVTIYGSPYDMSDYGSTNSDGSITTYC